MARTYFSEFFPARTVQGERGTTTLKQQLPKVGPWASGISYNVGDIFTWEGNSYAVTTAHTSTGTVPDIGKALILGEVTGIGGQTLQDNSFLPAWWTLPGNASRQYWGEARSKYAALLTFEAGSRRIINKGPVEKLTPAYPGEALFYRLSVDPTGTATLSSRVINSQGDYVVDSGGNSVVVASGGEDVTYNTELVTYNGETVTISGQALTAANYDLLVFIEWLDRNGNLVGTTPNATQIVSFSKGKQLIIGSAIAPKTSTNIAYARLVITYASTLTDKTGTWAIYDPWLAEYQPNADNTSEEVPILVPIPTIKVNATHTGELTTPLPIVIKAARKKGDIDVSPSSTWSIDPVSVIAATINNTVDSTARGTITITGVTTSGRLKIISFRDGVTLTQEVLVDVVKAAAPAPTAPPPSTEGGTTTPTEPSTYTIPLDGVIVSSSTMTQVGGVVTLVASRTTSEHAGPIEYALPYELSDASVQLEYKWQVSTDGGTVWNDLQPYVSNPDTQWAYRTLVTEYYDDGTNNFVRDDGTNVQLQTKMGAIQEHTYAQMTNGYIATTHTGPSFVAGTTYKVRLVMRQGAVTGVNTNVTLTGTASVKA